MKIKSFSLFLFLLNVSACSPFSPQIYDWRGYESAMLAEVLDSNNFNRQETIKNLSESLDKIPTSRIPPGALLHLAFLMQQEGLDAESQILVKREAELFPEATHWTQQLTTKK